MTPPRILLLACYEMGHQPLSLAWPLASLAAAGLDAHAVDLSIDRFPLRHAADAAFVGIAVPMHTALRLGVQAARKVRRNNPDAHICFYGLYAWLNAEHLFTEASAANVRLADTVLAGEYEHALTNLAAAVLDGRPYETLTGVTTPARHNHASLQRQHFPLPRRSSLPPLSEYARYIESGKSYIAGYTEASRGCLHTCRHCPVVPIYKGRFFVVPVETVVEDIRQQVQAGARHITFGDPDFLNGPGHAVRLAKSLCENFPGVSFDFTTKVEHLLQHRALLPTLRELGASFVVSAFESVSEKVLAQLHKGHTVADMEEVLRVAAAAGLPIQPTWVAFTPWTTMADYLSMLAWIRRQGLIAHVPVVQLAVRLLIPPGSALLEDNREASWLGALDPELFGYRWEHPDPRMDQLHRAVMLIAEHAPTEPYEAFRLVEETAYRLADRPVPPLLTPPELMIAPPRLTEDWFC